MLSRTEPLDLEESLSPLYLIGIVALRLAAKVGSSIFKNYVQLQKDILLDECVIKLERIWVLCHTTTFNKSSVTNSNFIG